MAPKNPRDRPAEEKKPAPKKEKGAHKTGKKAGKKAGKKEFPRTYLDFAESFPKIVKTHEALTEAADKFGPLDRKACELVKIGICLGAGLESALKSHVKRALSHGASRKEVEQVIALGMTSCGFPRTVAAWSWARPLLD